MNSKNLNMKTLSPPMEKQKNHKTYPGPERK